MEHSSGDQGWCDRSLIILTKTSSRTIYDFAFVTYADLPRGAIKNNSMRRLAATTLMEILPPHIAERVNKKMEEDPSGSHDFLSLVGLVSYYGAGEEH